MEINCTSVKYVCGPAAASSSPTSALLKLNHSLPPASQGTQLNFGNAQSALWCSKSRIARVRPKSKGVCETFLQIEGSRDRVVEGSGKGDEHTANIRRPPPPQVEQLEVKVQGVCFPDFKPFQTKSYGRTVAPAPLLDLLVLFGSTSAFPPPPPCRNSEKKGEKSGWHVFPPAQIFLLVRTSLLWNGREGLLFHSCSLPPAPADRISRGQV